MSFGFFLSDLILFTNTISLALEAIRCIDVEHEPLSLALSNLDSTFRAAEQTGLDNFTEDEIDGLKEVVGACEPTMDSLEKISTFVLVISNSALGDLYRASWKEKQMDGELDEMAGVLSQCGKRAVQLVMRAHIRRWSTAPLAINETYSSYAHTIAPVGVKEAIIPFRLTFAQLPRPRVCVLIGAFFLAFVALSCFLGIFFTTRKSYGYSMGDAFTLASYVIAVGAFISTAILASHYPRCRCWQKEPTETLGQELVSLSQQLR